MHIDLEQLESSAELRSAYCIVGGGIAGLVLAKKLASFGADVIVLEAGGLELEERSQALYSAEMARRNHNGATSGRFRTFGGSSTRWGGQLLPYTKDIFAPVHGSPSLAWPLDASELTPYYDEVQQLFDAGTLPFSNELLPALHHPQVPLPSHLRLRYSKWAPFGKRNLAQSIGRNCVSHPHVKVVTHANVASLDGDGARITHVRVLDYKSRQFLVKADRFIVACGTIESSRLLLSSPDIPNEHKQFGKYFHDHVSFHAAQLPLEAKREVAKKFGPFLVNNVLLTPKIEATSELQRDAGLVAVMAHFVVEEPEDSGIAAVRKLLVSIQQGRLAEAIKHNFLPMLKGAGDIAHLLWSSKVEKRRAISKRAIVHLNIDMEQPGLPTNQIRLSEATDELGIRKAIVDWNIGDAEYETACKFARMIKNEFEQMGLPAFDWTTGLLEGIRPDMADTFHSMGGLRMGVDPTTSVVNTNLQVHGISNLYVASCAVYPSGGSSNPTFTLIALTLRLADFLRPN